MPIPLLETQRLILRDWLDKDVEPFARLNADPEVMRYFPSTLSLEETKQKIERIQEGIRDNPFGVWAVERKDTGEFIGYIGLAIPRFEASFTPCVEIGWRLIKEAWGLGFATEGARRVLHYGFEEVGLKEILSFTSTLNVPSWKVMERIGMTRNPDEDFDHPRVEKGHVLERHVLYRIQNPKSLAHA